MRKLSLLLASLLALVLVPAASAHPADIYFHNYLFSFSSEGIEIVWEIIPGPMLTQLVWDQADQDQDSLISDSEAVDWGRTVQEKFSVSLDQRLLILQFNAIEWPESLANFRTGDQPIRIDLSARWPEGLDVSGTLEFHNQFANSLHWFSLEAHDGLTFSTPFQDEGMIAVVLSVRQTAGGEMLTQWESGRPEIPALVVSLGLGNLAQQAAAQSTRQQGVTGILEGLIRNNETSAQFFLTSFGLALLLGALHALSPGHGKTVVAAYLVGASGKFYHAIALGSIVTLTHTGSVFALGLATLAASRYLMPNHIFPLLEIISGVLILILGIGLLYPRVRDWHKKRQLDQQIYALQPNGQSTHSQGAQRLVLNQPITEIGPDHSHLPESGGYIPRAPIQGRPLQGITWRSLFTLGISGGLVPCPDAIAILLIAVTIQRVGFGLSLIISFSLGLAVVLILIGLMIVQGRRLFERLRWFDRVAYTMPVISALIVAGLGALLTFNAAHNLNTPQSLEPVELSSSAIPFKLNTARVLYLDTDENARYQIFSVPALGGTPEQITSNPGGIASFSVSPDGRNVIYAAVQEDTHSAFWVWKPDSQEHALLLDCAPDFCKNTVWSPDGIRLIYERLNNPTDSASLGITSLWWWDFNTGETASLFQDTNIPGLHPRWSAGGSWLSYATLNPSQIRLYDLATGQVIEIALKGNLTAAWHPYDKTLLYTEYLEVGNLYINKLYRYDLVTNQVEQLTIEGNLDDNLPSWSPDGETIAVVRREWVDELAEIGDQIWLMSDDGTSREQFTFQSAVIHGLPTWSPDGSALLYHVYNLDSSDSPTAIQVLVIENRQTVTIATSGISPQWLP